MTLTTMPLRPEDRAAWEVLAREYKDFYQTPTPDEAFATAWMRLLRQDGIHGLGAYRDGHLVGFAHYLYHTSTWVERVCYLQDLYTAPAARNQGVARALIDAVAEQARTDGAVRYYWLTQEGNTTARALYDRVAQFGGFLRYDYPILG